MNSTALARREVHPVVLELERALLPWRAVTFPRLEISDAAREAFMRALRELADVGPVVPPRAAWGQR